MLKLAHGALMLWLSSLLAEIQSISADSSDDSAVSQVVAQLQQLITEYERSGEQTSSFI